MPTLGSVLKVVAPTAVNVGTNYLANRGLKNATNTVTSGANAAQAKIDAATLAAQKRQDEALKQQQGLYNTTTTNQQPYQQTGLLANTQYQGLLTNPTKFDPETVMQEPGYQFGLAQTQKAVDRQGMGVFNGKQVAAKDRAVLNYATAKYDDAFNRFMQTQQRQDNLIKGGIDIGQGANAAVQSAGTTLGQAYGHNADANAQYGINGAEDAASLELAKANAAATNGVLASNNNSNTIGKVLDAAPGILKTVAPGVAAKLGIGAATGAGTTAATSAGLSAAVGAGGPAAATGAAATAIPGGAAALEPGAAAATASGGGLGSTLAALATNPITIGIAGALAVGAVWLKSQAHWEANTAVKDFENPFHEKTLAPFAAEWDKAIKSGTMTADAGPSIARSVHPELPGLYGRDSELGRPEVEGQEEGRGSEHLQSLQNDRSTTNSAYAVGPRRTATGGINANPADRLILSSPTRKARLVRFRGREGQSYSRRSPAQSGRKRGQHRAHEAGARRRSRKVPQGDPSPAGAIPRR